jgi:Uma2 family endonuclease
MATPATAHATFEDLRALEHADRMEIIDGAIVEKAAPSMEHSTSQFELSAALAPFSRRTGGDAPGGWWIATEVHVAYGRTQLYCHDVVGWRRDRVPERPTGWPVRIRPDWVCEIVSPSHEKRDLVDKLQILHRAEVPHYWIIKPEEAVLVVHRWSKAGYTIVLTASTGETVRAEPFDAIELHVGRLFGAEDDG